MASSEEKLSGTAQFHTSISALAHSASSSSEAKYGGLIERGLVKTIRKDMIQLFSYVYSVAPSFGALHSLVTVIRIMQFFGPSLCAQYQHFWGYHTSHGTTITIIAILFHFIPVHSRLTTALPFLYFYSSLNLLVLILLFYYSHYFKVNAQVPNVFSTFIAFYFALFAQIFHPVCIELTFELISKMIFADHEVSNNMSVILPILITIVISLLFFWIVTVISSQNLTFRQDSLMSTSLIPPRRVFYSTIALTSIFSLNTYSKGFIHYLLQFGGSLMYFMCSLIPFNYGGFIDRSVSSSIFACSITGAVISVAIGVMELLSLSSSVSIVFSGIMIFIVSQMISQVLFENKRNLHLELLDLILNDKTVFDQVLTPNQFVNMAVSGFGVAHPVCLSWDFLRYGTDKWPKEPEIWYIFGKYVAIYPEETQALSWIYHSIISGKLRGMAARAVKEEAISITRQREMNLSPNLKEKLTKINKQVEGTKHKLRHVWDVVIQGNIGEVESATKRVFVSIERDQADYLHLLRRFPNNRFVMRAYSRFLLEIVADVSTYNDIVEKIRLLHRGSMVAADQAHELGLVANPNLPEKLHNLNYPTTTESKTRVLDFDSETDDLQTDDSHRDVVKSLVDHVSVPSIQKSRNVNIISFLVFFVSLFILLIYLVNMIVSLIEEPLDFMYKLSNIRSYTYQLAAFSNRMVYQKLDIYTHSYSGNLTPPSSLGSTWKTEDQLVYIMSLCTSMIQTLGSFRSFEHDDIYISKAQSLVFGESINYSMFSNSTKRQFTKMALQGAIMDMVIQLSKLLMNNLSNIDYSILEQGSLLNPLYNCETLAKDINEALSMITLYIDEKDGSIEWLALMLLIGLVSLAIFIYIYIIYYQISIIRSDKNQCYYCLLSLPKNTVSSLVENIRVLKKDSTGGSSSTKGSSTTGDAEMSKQEENILKIFNTGGTSSTNHAVDEISIVLCSVFILILHIVCTILLYYLTINENITLKHLAPHLDYLPGSYSMFLSSLFSMQVLAGTYDPHGINIIERGDLISRFHESIEKSSDYFTLARYGANGKDQPPFLGFDDGLAESNSRNSLVNNVIISSDERSVFRTCQSDYLFPLLTSYLNFKFSEYEDGKKVLDSHDDILTVIWDISIYPLYDTFFHPIFENILPRIDSEMKNSRDQYVPIVVIMICVASLIEIAVLVNIQFVKEHIKFVLGLLMHCPSTVVLQTTKIISVLSGDFVGHQLSIATRDNSFYDSVFENLPDAIAIIGQEGLIENVNKSWVRLFGALSSQGSQISSLFVPETFVGEYSSFVESMACVEQNLVFKKDSQTQMNLRAISAIYKQKRIISMRDFTQTARYNTLIKEERTKSDKLLASILPITLVKRVQAGEKNISFAVQSVSIVFIDIVSFTPWCGSLPAATVMSTLNSLFKRFDALVAMYPTMTKIKCIGDCYMAAGGVFSEISQPAKHAKEIVSFGLDAIDAVQEMNKELNQNLEIRIGVNTGGPVVAGVLGIGKPTFEILGPSINMAQQMEHSGVPMKVHISRAVYELIYGDIFDIKERGAIEIKGGNVITYLVSR